MNVSITVQKPEISQTKLFIHTTSIFVYKLQIIPSCRFLEMVFLSLLLIQTLFRILTTALKMFDSPLWSRILAITNCRPGPTLFTYVFKKKTRPVQCTTFYLTHWLWGNCTKFCCSVELCFTKRILFSRPELIQSF